MKDTQYIAYVQNELWGIIDENFKVIIEPKYQFLSANGYHPKVFFKVIQENEYDGVLEYYYINLKDEKISDAIEVNQNSILLNCYTQSTNKEDMLFSLSTEGVSVFYNHDGKIVLGTSFDYDEENWIFEQDFHIVHVDGKKGVIDKLGSFIIEPLHEDVLIHWDGEYIVFGNDTKKELYDIRRKVFLDFDCEDICISKKFIFIKRGNYAIYTKEFEKLTDFIYEQPRTNDMVIVAKKDSKAGMLDMNLEQIIPFMYDNLGFTHWSQEDSHYTESRILAELDHKWLVLDKENRTIFSSQENYEGSNSCIDTTYKYIPILDGYIESHENSVVLTSHDGEKEYLIENRWIAYYGDEEHYFVYVMSEENKVGFINLKTNYVQECIFSDTYVVSEDRIFVCQDNKWGLMNSKGEYLLDMKCVNETTAYPFAFFKSLQNLLSYDLEFLDLYDAYSLDGDYICAFTKSRSDLYLINQEKIEILFKIEG